MSRVGIFREDVRKTNKQFYSLKDKETTVYELPSMQVLTTSGMEERDIYRMFDYSGIWTMGRFINRVKSYTKRELGKNFSRMPIEVEWGAVSGYRAMMWVPGYITQDIFEATMADLHTKFSNAEPSMALTSLPPRRCAQLLHIGRYEFIDSTRKQLTENLQSQGLRLIGGSQEIFINHPHCNPPEKLNILIRQEVEVEWD
ncbi:GyrI-like domain-containing protein [Paenibacillus albus]|uniref:GyrI-like small molecule binding domain-containing protein n=1 Tax=Paenibacillus albus TaxID=2495582 RepID=A0A3S9A2E4_9BACL|nr:GyrI-like domain-containing protein [Paenibacillus albus]AZN39928.1 hypothetical protein EJC50_09905 [Paenibacillus albus]